MHDAAMLLGRTQIAGILEGHPGMSCFKNHAQHLAPQVLRLKRFVELELAASSHFFILFVTRFKRLAVQVMQVRHIVG